MSGAPWPSSASRSEAGSAGCYTLACCRHLAAKGYPIVTMAPGMNKPEIYRILAELGPVFDQIVLLGYPPYLKDVIDGGPAAGVDWPKLKIRLVMAGEVFSEEWRSLVGGAPRLDRSPLRLRLALRHRRCRRAGQRDAALDPHPPLPRRPSRGRRASCSARRGCRPWRNTIPISRFFEAVDGTLLFSGDNGVPLLRYHIADSGGLIAYDEMLRFLARHGFDPRAGLAGQGWRGVRRLPFVYVFGRANFAVSYFGANVYPENIAIGLEQAEVAPWTTGKFVLMAREGLGEAPALYVAVELAPGITADRREGAADRRFHPGPALAPQQRVRQLHPGRLSPPGGGADAGRRSRLVPRGRQASLFQALAEPLFAGVGSAPRFLRAPAQNCRKNPRNRRNPVPLRALWLRLYQPFKPQLVAETPMP